MSCSLAFLKMQTHSFKTSERTWFSVPYGLARSTVFMPPEKSILGGIGEQQLGSEVRESLVGLLTSPQRHASTSPSH